MLIKVARFDPGTGDLSRLPRSNLLMLFGEELGKARLHDESEANYCKRVFRTEAQ